MKLLATRCPVCKTAFRVAADHLKMQQGWVQCGKCNEIFNAKGRLFAPKPRAEISQQGLESGNEFSHSMLPALPEVQMAPPLSHPNSSPTSSKNQPTSEFVLETQLVDQFLRDAAASLRSISEPKMEAPKPASPAKSSTTGTANVNSGATSTRPASPAVVTQTTAKNPEPAPENVLPALDNIALSMAQASLQADQKAANLLHAKRLAQASMQNQPASFGTNLPFEPTDRVSERANSARVATANPTADKFAQAYRPTAPTAASELNQKNPASAVSKAPVKAVNFAPDFSIEPIVDRASTSAPGQFARVPTGRQTQMNIALDATPEAFATPPRAQARPRSQLPASFSDNAPSRFAPSNAPAIQAAVNKPAVTAPARAIINPATVANAAQPAQSVRATQAPRAVRQDYAEPTGFVPSRFMDRSTINIRPVPSPPDLIEEKSPYRLRSHRGIKRWFTPDFVREARLQKDDGAWNLGLASVMIAATVLLSFLLFVQVVHAAYRSSSTLSPSSFKLVKNLCVIAFCGKEPLSGIGNNISMESSQLQDLGGGVLRLTLVTRNNRDVDVILPELDLTLLGPNEQVVARKVFYLTEFAEGNTDPLGNVLPANRETKFVLNLKQEGSEKISGYRADLFYSH